MQIPGDGWSQREPEAEADLCRPSESRTVAGGNDRSCMMIKKERKPSSAHTDGAELDFILRPDS